MNIYFHIDELKRDAVVASALKKEFAKHGHTLVYGNRVSNRLLNYFHGVFDIVILPRPHFFYDNWGEDWLYWKSKVVTFSTESLGIICKDHQIMARTLLEKEYFQGSKQYVERLDALCFWGVKQLQSIKDYAPEIVEKCYVVGHPRHDQACSGIENVKIDKKGKIGFVTRAVGLNDYFGRSALTAFEVLFDEWFLYELDDPKTGSKLKSTRPSAQPLNVLISQAIDVESTLRAIKALEDEGYQVSIRPHPKENVKVWQQLLDKCKLKAKLSSVELPISAWLEDIEYVIGPPSTSFYDSLMLGVTPISLENFDSRRSSCIDELWEDNNRLMPFVHKPSDENELLKILKQEEHLYKNEDVLRILKEEANFPDCKSSLERFAGICIDVAKSPKENKGVLLFEAARSLFNVVWRIRNKIIRRNENSAMFAMDHKTKCFIDELTTVD